MTIASVRWVFVIGLLALSTAAVAAPVTFSCTMDGTPRSATLDEIAVEGVPYVSLVDLAEQLGGGYSLLPTRMRVDFAGSTAWVQAGDRRVNAMRIFSLGHPVVRSGSDVLIASADAPTLFEHAFRVSLSRTAAALAPELEAVSPTFGTDGNGSSPALGSSRPSRVRVIVVDAGHGGFDAGVQGAGGIAEKELALDVARKLGQALENSVPQRIVLTRTEDIALDDVQRATIAENVGANLLVTLHAGVSPSQRARGSAVYFQAGARSGVGNRTVDVEGLANALGAALGSGGPVPFRGVDSARLRVASNTGIPTLMIELGCLTNSEDSAALSESAARVALAGTIAAAIRTAVQGAAPEPGGVIPR